MLVGGEPGPRTAPGADPEHGATLTELLLAMTLLVLLSAVAFPSLAQLAAVSGVRVDAGRLFASIQLARAHAAREVTPVLLCPRSSGERGRCGTDYDAGWQLLPDSEAVPLASELLRDEAPLRSALRIRGADGTRTVGAALRFRADGTTGRGATFRFCLPVQMDVPGWRLVVSATGRPRLGRDLAACPR